MTAAGSGAAADGWLVTISSATTDAGITPDGCGCGCGVAAMTILLGADDGLSGIVSVCGIVRVTLLVPDMMISILRGGGVGATGAELVGGPGATAIAAAGGALVSGGGTGRAVCGTEMELG